MKLLAAWFILLTACLMFSAYLVGGLAAILLAGSAEALLICILEILVWRRR